MKRIYTTAVISLSLILGGCSTMYNSFDCLGQHFPVVGERCENWQCFTASGQAASREKLKQQQAAGPQDCSKLVPPGSPSPSENSRATAKNY